MLYGTHVSYMVGLGYLCYAYDMSKVKVSGGG